MKNEKYLILFILLLTATIISTSYAYFSPEIVKENVTDTKINSGNVNVIISDEKINTDSIEPIYDSNYETDAFSKEFNIKSISSLNTCNKIVLNISNISDSLKSEYLKYKLVSEEDIIEGNFKDVNDKLILLDKIFLNSNESKKYKLYIWISYQDNINQIDMLGTTLNAKLSVEALDAKDKTNCE